MNRLIPIFFIFFFIAHIAYPQTVFPLYADKIPNSKTTENQEKTVEENILLVRNISVPTLQHYPAPENTATGAAVIIVPGGGYSINAIKHEGWDVAKRFTEAGVTAFVLKYRIPEDKTMIEKEIGPLQDAQQAIKIVRENAAQHKIDPNRIGILGFSAGGHLASTAGTHFKSTTIPNDKKTSLRPDFMILVYPVISFQDEICHKGSRNNLLGDNASKEKINLYSNELQVSADTPPTFLIHASDDAVVVPANSIQFYDALIRNKVAAELHIYQAGGHGFGLTNKTTQDDWFERCVNWLESNSWFKK